MPHGETCAIITVLQLPPNESLSNRVNFESLYGTKFFKLFLQFSYKAFMQLERANKDLLILAPSFILNPTFPVELALSDPAKSINDNLPSNFVFEPLFY